MLNRKFQLKKRFMNFAFTLISAFMLGMSNVILEEDRMLNDSSNKVELKQKEDLDSDRN